MTARASTRIHTCVVLLYPFQFAILHPLSIHHLPLLFQLTSHLKYFNINMAEDNETKEEPVMEETQSNIDHAEVKEPQDTEEVTSTPEGVVKSQESSSEEEEEKKEENDDVQESEPADSSEADVPATSEKEEIAEPVAAEEAAQSSISSEKSVKEETASAIETSNYDDADADAKQDSSDADASEDIAAESETQVEEEQEQTLAVVENNAENESMLEEVGSSAQDIATETEAPAQDQTEKEQSPVVVETVDEDEEATEDAHKPTQDEQLELATEAAKSAIAQPDTTSTLPVQVDTTPQVSSAPEVSHASSVPHEDPQVFPEQPASRSPSATSQVQAPPQVSPVASVPPTEAQSFPNHSPAQMKAPSPVSFQASPQPSPVAAPVPQPVVVTSQPMQVYSQVSPASMPQQGMQVYPPQPQMQAQVTPRASPTGQVAQASPVMMMMMVPQPAQQMQASPQGSHSSVPVLHQAYAQPLPVSVQTTPQASPTSFTHQPTGMVPSPAHMAQSPQQQQQHQVPVPAVKLDPATSPTSAISSPPYDSPKSTTPPQDEEDPSRVANFDNGDDDDDPEDPAAKDQFHQDQFMEEFHTFGRKSMLEKVMYKIRNYTWRERIPILVGIVLLFVGLGLVIGHFAGGDDNEFIFDGSEQCQAVAKGNALPGEDNFPVLRLNWILDISTYSEYKQISTLTEEVKTKFQSLVIPTLAGCVHERHDDEARAQKFMIVNGFVRSARDAGDCGVGRRRPCYRIYVNVALWTRDALVADDFSKYLFAQFGYEIVEELDTSPIISETSLVQIEHYSG